MVAMLMHPGGIVALVAAMALLVAPALGFNPTTPTEDKNSAGISDPSADRQRRLRVSRRPRKEPVWDSSMQCPDTEPTIIESHWQPISQSLPYYELGSAPASGAFESAKEAF